VEHGALRGAATAVPARSAVRAGGKDAVQRLATLVAPLHAALHGAARRVPPPRFGDASHSVECVPLKIALALLKFP